MQLPKDWKLPETIQQRLGHRGSGKQRAMEAEGHLLLVLHKAPQADQKHREIVLFWRNPEGDWFCSEGRRKILDRKHGYKLLLQHLQSYSQVEAEFDHQYDSAQTAEDYFQLLQDLTPFNRAVKNLHITLQSAREEIPQDQEIIDLRDLAYEIDRNVDLIHTDTKNSLDFYLAKKAEEQTRLSLQSVRSGDRLNLLVAIFLPLTAISSIFGMNLPSGLENASPVLFWLVLGGGIWLGFWIRGWVFQNSIFHRKNNQ